MKRNLILVVLEILGAGGLELGLNGLYFAVRHGLAFLSNYSSNIFYGVTMLYKIKRFLG